jgi:molybdopterin/thiamine biosynthesis adenylyltransferase
VREGDEVRAGKLPGATSIPRGFLESRIEATVPDRSHKVVLYCASGVRSALAANTLVRDLGLRGRRLDDRRHHALEGPRLRRRGPRSSSPRSSASATRATSCCPRSARRGRRSCSTRRSSSSARAASGSPTALYLAAAGVGTLGIVDDDVVDVSNLQRQVIHTTDRVGVPKVDSAEIAINALNPDVEVVKHTLRLDASNIMDVLPGYDIVVDGVDNFPTRYLLNDATVRLRIPVISAAILGFEGQLSVFKPYDGPATAACSASPPPGRARAVLRANGVLGVLPGTMGLLQATEVIKLITGQGSPLIGRLLMYDALEATTTELKVRRDPECPICSREPSEISDEELGVFPDYEAFCAAAG